MAVATENRTQYEVLISAHCLRIRIASMAKRISAHYRGRKVVCVAGAKQGEEFMHAVVASLTCEVEVHSIEPLTDVHREGRREVTEIFYTPQIDVAGRDVLLFEGILATGQTAGFLARSFLAHGAASLVVCSLLDRRTERRVRVPPLFYGFRVGPERVAGFGLGESESERALPFIIATSGELGLKRPAPPGRK